MNILNISNAPSATIAGLNSYRHTLDKAWRDHLALRAPGAPTVISLFAGGGGSSLGYSMAGYRELLAVEQDDDAAATLERNLPGVPLYHGDIRTLSSDDVLTTTGLAQGDLDVLDGSPPCQGFSTAGRRRLDDERNRLFKEYTRLLQGLKPKVFVMENVHGLVKGKMKLVFVEILRELKACGYQVSARLMNTMYFGVPQSRRRLIFIGVRDDLCGGGGGIAPSHPRPQSSPITFRQACEDLRGNCSEDRMLPPVLRQCAPYQSRKWSMDERVFRHFKGSAGGMFNIQWASWDRVCGTVLRSEIALGGIVHPDRKRYISLPEAKRLSSFPDEFELTNRKQGIERIGNAVPPLFMRAIAEHIRENFLDRIRCESANE